MPNVAPLAEFNRSQADVISQLEQSGEPMYLTRNGRSSVVVMDAAAFDRMQEARERTLDRERETYAALLRGYQDVLDGKTVSLDDADARIRAAKGW